MAVPSSVPGPSIVLGELPQAPRVSVLMSSYNYANYIGTTIESVLGQTYRNLELVICDDGSTDDSVEVVHRYERADARVRLISQKNAGQAAALNAAFNRSSGDIVCTLDCDDWFAPSKVEKVVAAFHSHPDCGAALHYMQLIDSRGARKAGIVVTAEGYIGSRFLALSVDNPYPPTSGISLRREVAQRVFPVPEVLRTWPDYQMAAAASLLTRSCVIREELGGWRMHDSASGGAAGVLTSLDETWLRKHLAGVELGQGAVAEWARRELGLDLDYSTCRQYVEYRLALGIVAGDRALVRTAAADLRRGFRTNRGHYPTHRYHFWNTLSILPSPVARGMMQLAFRWHYRSGRQTEPSN